MRRESFNKDWHVGPAKTSFASIVGGRPQGSPVTLPHDAARDETRTATTSNGARTGYYPSGFYEYTKDFAVPADWLDRTVLLEFEGVYRDAVVRVNGEVVTHRANGYTEFLLDIHPYLRFGEDNGISVTVRTHEDSRWYTGAGIYRDTWLYVGEEIDITPHGLTVTSIDIAEDLAVVETAVEIRNVSRRTSTMRVHASVAPSGEAECTSASQPVTLMPGTTEVVRIRHYVRHPQLWGPDSPALYQAFAEVRSDERTLGTAHTSFGIRRLQLDPERGLRINGQPIKLRGACVHHDNGPLGSAAIPRAEHRRVELLKRAGFNALRSAHNPMSRAMLDACDRLGVLVMDELTDVWTDAKTPFDSSLTFAEHWEEDVEAMVRKDINHPSVIMYSIGNEVSEVGTPHGSVLARHLAEKVRTLDPTRLVTNAVNALMAAGNAVNSAHGSSAATDVNAFITSLGSRMSDLAAMDAVTSRTEESFGVLDVAGLNYGESRYSLDRNLFPDRISVGSETFPGHLDVLWPLVMAHDWVLGDFTWTGWDYLGEAGIGRAFYSDDENPPQGIASPFPWLHAGCGTLDITGARRPISYWREIVWGLRTDPFVTVHPPQDHARTPVIGPWAWPNSTSSWSWDVPAGSPTTVDVYSPSEEVELFINGRSAGRADVGTEKAYIASFVVDYEPGELLAVSLTAGTETGRFCLRTAKGARRIVACADRPEIAADSSDLAYVSIEIRDEKGNLFTCTDHVATVTVTGAGQLVAVGSGRPDPLEGFAGPSLTTFGGRMMAIVRPTGAGDIRITVESAGMATGEALVRAV